MKKRYLYIAAAPSYSGNENIKIGITDNYERRIKALRNSYDSLLKMMVVFDFEDHEVPARIEERLICECYHKRPKWPDYLPNKPKTGREYFNGYTKDFIDLVKRAAKEIGAKYSMENLYER